MLQHYFHMSYAYYKFDSQMYCIQHTLLNIFSYCLLHFTNLHKVTLKPLIHMGLPDDPTQKKLPNFFFFLVPIKNYIYIYIYIYICVRLTLHCYI